MSEDEDDLNKAVERLRQGGHVTPELLAACQAGKLTRGGGERVISHLAGCTRCARSVLAQMGELDPHKPIL